MSVDPTDPDTFDDTYEDEPDEEAQLEAPREDAAEQQADLLARHRAPITGRDDVEVDPAELADEARVVELNEEEDEYR